jgi:hypothetical protein
VVLRLDRLNGQGDDAEHGKVEAHRRKGDDGEPAPPRRALPYIPQ